MQSLLKKHEAYIDTTALEVLKIMLMRVTPTGVEDSKQLSKNAYKQAVAMLHTKLELEQMIYKTPILSDMLPKKEASK